MAGGKTGSGSQGILKRLRATGYGEFSDGQLRTLQRRVLVWRTRIILQLVYKTEQQTTESMAFVAWSATEVSSQKCLDQLPGQGRSDNLSSQTKDIHVVVFDALAGGENILDKPCTHTENFVRSDGRTHAASADRDSTLNLPSNYSSRQWDDEFRVVICGV
jgi:hypothetical protein